MSLALGQGFRDIGLLAKKNADAWVQEVVKTSNTEQVNLKTNSAYLNTVKAAESAFDTIKNTLKSYAEIEKVRNNPLGNAHKLHISAFDAFANAYFNNQIYSFTLVKRYKPTFRNTSDKPGVVAIIFDKVPRKYIIRWRSGFNYNSEGPTDHLCVFTDAQISAVHIPDESGTVYATSKSSLFQYLFNGVEPPPTLDANYSKGEWCDVPYHPKFDKQYIGLTHYKIFEQVGPYEQTRNFSRLMTSSLHGF
jgi:hypothetical protein